MQKMQAQPEDNGGVMKIKVPGDIKRYIVVRVGGRILACTALLAAVITGVTLNLADILERGISYAVLLYAVPIVLVFVVTGVPKKLIDSTWIGEVTEQKVKTIIQSRVSGANYKTGFDGYGSKMSEYRNVLTLTVKTENGNSVSFKACETSDTELFENMLADFKAESKVAHVYGTKYLRLIDEDAETVKCIICGEENEKGEEKCAKCKHSLKITEEL